MTPTFNADDQEIRNIRARHQKHQEGRGQQNPENILNVPNHFFL
jgi:hypothetical protein